MTNPSPQDPQNPIPERRQRPATGLTFDEMVGIFVAFTTIGAILFWSMGSKKSELANNFGLGGNSSLLSSDKTTATGFGIGANDSKANSGKLESNDRELIAQLSEQDKPVAFVPASQELNLPPKAKAKAQERSYQLDSGAKLVPLAGIAALPVLKNNAGKNKVAAPKPAKAKKVEEPVAVPKQTETAKTKPAPKQNVIPKDVTPEDWAYPFVKQMSNNGLVSALTGDQKFEPNKLITRASMATLISRAFEMEPQTEKIKNFKDVSNKNEIAADIDKAVRLGYMQGYSEDTFRPLENIPRYQVLVALATGLGLKSSQNADQTLQKLDGSGDIPDWAKEQVAAAYEAKLIVNRPDFAKNSLMPNESATRGEVAAMVHQALVKKGRLKPLNSEYILNP